MFTAEEKDLASKAARLTGSLINVIPGDAEKKKAYLELIAVEVKTVSEEASVPNEKPLKAISDNLTDTLHAINAVIPDNTDPSKARAKKRFTSAVGILNGLLDMVGL